MNDLDVSTQYDVDDSVYVYEEICGDPQLTTIRDYREVSGGGKKDLKQGFSSGSYAATSGVKADSGSVESSATLTSTSLSATQRSNIGGSFAQSLLAGSMGYLGGIAFTGQYVGVASGILSTVQTLSLGQSIYSTQNFQASGIFPLAVGYARVGFGSLNGNDVQGAFIAAGACEEGSISGYMGAEVIRVPDAQYVDPVAYGSNMVARGDKAAGIIAGAGNLNEFGAQNQFANFNGLLGQGAITGAVGIGEDSFASVDYIEARTDGHETSAFEVDAKAKGDDAAIVAAGAGSFSRKIGIGIYPTLFFYNKIFDMQGSIAGATAIGDDSKANADFIGAITDGERTSAGGIDLLAKGDGFAAVGAGAGSFYRNQGLMQSPFFFYAGDNFGLQGALAGAAAGGKKSEASADFVRALTDGETTFAEGYKTRASGDEFAGLGAGAGSFYMDQGLMQSPFFFGTNDNLGAQGAIAGAAALGKNCRVKADHVSAETNGDYTRAWGSSLRAKSDGFAAVGAGAVSLYMDHGLMQSPFFAGSFDSLGIEGAIAGAAAAGKNSRASANYVGATNYVDAFTDGETTFAKGYKLRASGDEFAGLGAGAGSLYMDPELMQSPFIFAGLDSLGIQGALAGAAAGGKKSEASANFIGALTDGETTFAVGHKIRARGDGFAAVGAGAGSLYLDRGLMKSPSFSGSFDSLGIEGAIAGAAAGGENSKASADYIGALNDGSVTSAGGSDLLAKGDEFAATGGASGCIRQFSGNNSITGPYSYLDIDGAVVADVGLGKGSQARSDYIVAGTNGRQAFAFGDDLEAKGETSAHALSGSGDGIGLAGHALVIDQGSVTGLSAVGNGAVSADLLAAGAGLDSESFGTGLQASGDKSALAYCAAGDKLTVLADSVGVKDGSLTGLGAQGKESMVSVAALASRQSFLGSTSEGYDLTATGKKTVAASAAGKKVDLYSDRIDAKEGSLTGLAAHGDPGTVSAFSLQSSQTLLASTSTGANLGALGRQALAASGAGHKIKLDTEGAEVEQGSLTGAAAYGKAGVYSEELSSNRNLVGSYSTGYRLAADGMKSAALASGVGAKVTIQSDENEAKAKVEQGLITGITAYQNAHVNGDELTSGDMLIEGSVGKGLLGSGEKSASAASGAGERVVIKADQDEGKATVDQGSIAGVTAYKNALVQSHILASGDMQLAIGSLALDGKGSVGEGLLGSGEKSASAASGAGDRVVIKADQDEGKATVDQGSITGLTAYKNAWVGSGLLASGDIQLDFESLALDGDGSIGTLMSGSGAKSASSASGFGETVVIKSNDDLGRSKVTNGGITGMAAHDGAEVGADLLGSAGVVDSSTGGTVAGWIGLNPSATGTMSALGTGSGSEVNIEADAAKVETTLGSVIGLTASGQNSRTSAESIGGYKTALVPTLAATKVLAQGDSASAASVTGLSAAIESDKISVTGGSVVGIVAAGGQVEADSLGSSNALPIGTNLKASGTTASAASATSLLSTATIESDKISVTGGRVVGMAAAGGQVEADSLGSSNALPSGTNLKASGTTASAASATSLASTVIETNKVTVNGGSMVGMAAENGEVTADSLAVSSLTSTSGLGLKASGDKSTAIAAAGNVITMQPSSSTVTSPVSGSAAMVALGASGSSEVSASSLEASNEVITFTAKGSVLQASGENYAMIGVAASGSITGGSLISFLPSSGASPYYGMTIPWGAYGGGRASGGTVTIANTVMAKASGTNYVIGGPGATTTNKDYANIQATGTQPVVFAAYKGLSPSPSVTAKTDGLTHQIWAYKKTTGGNKEVI